MTAKNAWIRFSQGPAGPRFDAAELLVTDEKIAELAELTAANTTWTGGEMIHFTQRADVDGVVTYYVRALPSTPLGRQDRDQMIGAGLIRRFDLEPHIVIHEERLPRTGWEALHQVRNTVCGSTVAVTHASADRDEVTCKPCRAVWAQAATVGGWLAQGCGVEARLVRGLWEYRSIEPKKEAVA